MDRRRFLMGGVFGTALVVSSPSAFAAKAQIYTKFLSSSAIEGYDAVSYFTLGKPVLGKKKLAYKWKGAWWYFASKEN